MELLLIACDADKENLSYKNNANKENSQPADESRGAVVRKKVALFPEGEYYQLLLMDIGDCHSAHLPSRGERNALNKGGRRFQRYHRAKCE